MMTNINVEKVSKRISQLKLNVTCTQCKSDYKSLRCVCGAAVCAACRRRGCVQCGDRNTHPECAPQEIARNTRHVRNLAANFVNLYNCPLDQHFLMSILSDKFPIVLVPRCNLEKSKKSTSPVKVRNKIEVLPNTEDFEDDSTVVHPQRSTRKRHINYIDENPEKQPIKKLNQVKYKESVVKENKSDKAKLNWNNVKRMRKEFSKLKKIDKSKLNVSIEMCKKATAQSAVINTNTMSTATQDTPFFIEETPETEKNIPNNKENFKNFHDNEKELNDIEILHSLSQTYTSKVKIKKTNDNYAKNTLMETDHHLNMKDVLNETVNKECNITNRIPFVLKGKLHPEIPNAINMATNDSHDNLQSKNKQTKEPGPNDIHITIRVGNKTADFIIRNNVENEEKSIDVVHTTQSEKEQSQKDPIIENSVVQTKYSENIFSKSVDVRQTTQIEKEQSQKYPIIENSVMQPKYSENILSKSVDVGQTTQIEKEQSQKYPIIENHIMQPKYSGNIFSKSVDVRQTIQSEKEQSQRDSLIHNSVMQPKYSENIFSTKDSCPPFLDVNEPKVATCDVHSPVAASSQDAYSDSVVEETPEKMKLRSTSRVTDKTNDSKNLRAEVRCNVSLGTQEINALFNATDSVIADSSSVPSVPTSQPDTIMETPFTMKKFTHNIRHVSTPLVRKSLNFNKPGDNNVRGDVSVALETVVAGSCLSAGETQKLKKLCQTRGWRYSNTYTADLTHLVVRVDEENKAQRSAKYMSAVAAGKWVVSSAWMEHSLLHLGPPRDEERFEALDWSGAPGPRRSRTATSKLFTGITFYCMPPFSILEVELLCGMLQAAGGRVVGSLEELPIAEEKPALVIAEREYSAEMKVTYMACEMGVVSVHSDWVLNCLGEYRLVSLRNMLLCSEELLPEHVLHWPAPLFEDVPE